MKKYFVTTFLALVTSLGFAQTQTVSYTELLSATAAENGQTLLNPFCGGINSTQLAHADLNNDGKNDLTIWDNNTYTIKTFINVGGPGQQQYQYAPKYAKNFPTIVDYLKLIDYNCDNIPDLFHRGTSGISISYGSYNSNNELTFTFYRELYYPGAFGPVNAYVQPNDIPIIEDIDKDGDLDFVSFDVLGAYAPWYKNLRVEDTLPCDSVRITVAENCYGKMYQTFYRAHQLNNTCKGISNKNNNQRHSGNCILSIDYNGDGLMDMMGGNISFNDAQLLINGGTLSNPLFISQDTLFDSNGHQLEMYTWPAPFYFDIDNDNDKDLVFTPHIDNSNTANYNAIGVYENIGTTAVPNLVWKNDSALIKSMIDVGRNSHPTLYDFDKDGLLDLFIGGEGIFNTNTKSKQSQLAYYKNITVPGPNATIAFELVTKDFLNLSTKNYSGIYPSFGDITGDNVDDLVLGNDSGHIAVYKNNATSNAVMPQFVWQTDSLPGIDVGNYSFPFVYDWNGDNKTDLLIGCELGTIWLYQDTSLTSIKEFKRVDTNIGNVKAGSMFSYFSYAVPYIGVVDSSMTPQLLIGNVDGTIERYDSFLNNTNTWSRLDSQMASIQTAFRSAPAIGDLDNDQRPELIIGSQNGGLQIFQFAGNVSNLISTEQTAKLSIQLYPNPAQQQLWIKAPTDILSVKSYIVRDISGRIMSKSGIPRPIAEGIDISRLPSGLYFLEIDFGGKMAIDKFMKSN